MIDQGETCDVGFRFGAGGRVSEDEIEQMLVANEELCRTLVRVGQGMMAADGGRVYGVDLIAMAAIKRTITVAAGFRLLVRAANYQCPAALVRLQLDTLLRFVALELVDDPHPLAARILGGESLRKVKDRNGRPLVDAYLVEHLAKRIPWVSRVYKETSGFIHLSDKHMFGPVAKVEDEGAAVRMLIHENDGHIRAEHWVEMVSCFHEATHAVCGAIASWAQRKIDVAAERTLAERGGASASSDDEAGQSPPSTR